MERHLLVGKEMNMSDLAEQGRDVYLSTIRGKIKFSFVESGGGNEFNIFSWLFDLRTIKHTY